MLPVQMLPTNVLLDMHQQRVHNADRHHGLQVQLDTVLPTNQRQPKRRRWFRPR